MIEDPGRVEPDQNPTIEKKLVKGSRKKVFF